MKYITTKNAVGMKGYVLRMSFFKHMILTITGRGIFTILGVVTGIITARVLGPQGKGELQAVILWPQVLTWLCSMGMGWANVFFFAKEPGQRSKLVANSFLFALTFGLVGILIGEAIIPKLLSGYPEHIVLLLRTFFLFVPLLLFSSLLLGVFQGCQNFVFYNIMWVLPNLLYAFSLVVLLLLTKLTVESAIYSWMGIHVVSLLLKLWLVSRLVPLSISPSFSIFKRTLNYGIKSHIGDISYILSNNLDQMFVIPILSPLEFGIYSIAVRMSRTIVLIPGAIMAVLIPEASRRTSKDAGDLTLWLIQLSFVILTILCVVLFIIAPYLIEFLFGERYLGTIEPFRILLIGSVFLGIGSIVDGGLKGTWRPLQVSYANWICIAVLAPCLSILVPLYGTTGAALSYDLGFLSRFLVLLIVFVKEQKISIGKLLSFKDNKLLTTLRNRKTA
ncbi:MAG: lipopolysaccharide biosynthesis protein [Candidatus Scalindua sp.]